MSSANSSSSSNGRRRRPKSLAAGRAVQQAVQMGLVARHYERIADHAVTIAERVVFMATGEHPGA